MDWFNGRLEVIDRHGNSAMLTDLSFNAACRWIASQPSDQLVEAYYHPSTMGMSCDPLDYAYLHKQQLQANYDGDPDEYDLS